MDKEEQDQMINAAILDWGIGDALNRAAVLWKSHLENYPTVGSDQAVWMKNEVEEILKREGFLK